MTADAEADLVQRPLLLPLLLLLQLTAKTMEEEEEEEEECNGTAHGDAYRIMSQPCGVRIAPLSPSSPIRPSSWSV
jgi:hypothetical protein